MKRLCSLKLGVLSLAILAMATFPLSASVVGHLSVANCGDLGGVTVGLTTIDWLTGSPSACLALSAGTNLTSVGNGHIPPVPLGTTSLINDLPGSPGIIGFMSIVGPGVSMYFDLAPVAGFGPGSPVSCDPLVAVDSSCSVPDSPFLLTRTLTGTSVTLLAHGTILDIGDNNTSYWNGAFTTQINGMTPLAIQNIILVGGFPLTDANSITSSFSGEFDVSATTPEPASMALIGGGLFLIALSAIKRRKRV